MSGDSGSEYAANLSTGAYYDALSRWTTVARTFGYGGGRSTLTVHRALADPRNGGRPTATRVHDVLAAALPVHSIDHALDAGCGMGGTMLDLAARCHATFTGVTLSPHQAAIGRRAIARAGLTARVGITVGSYDVPPQGSFELALAIESLAHSPSPGTSLAAIAGRLTQGGWLAIADDMPEPAARGSRDLATFQAGWRLPVLWGADEFGAALADLGCEIVTCNDLTAELRPRSLARIAALERLNRALRRLAPTANLRALLDSYRGGLALERLYRRSLMRYNLIVARRR